MSRIIYYLLIKPLSLLPLSALFLFSDFLYFVASRLIGYRKEVVRKNIENSFPDYSSGQVNSLVKKFHHYFTDLIVESIKIFSLSKEDALNRCVLLNPELLNKFYDQNKHVILVGGHYNNWEMLAVALNMQVKHQLAGIYTIINDKFFNKKFAQSRSKYGTGLVPKQRVKKYFKTGWSKPTGIIFGADQSPAWVKKNTYWTTFLNQETAVVFGTEKYAKKYNYPVVYVAISKVKRGHYQMELSLLEDDPKNSAYGSITEKHTRMLEKQIREYPEYYLWTHRRWKLKKPA
jgi:KDO2-lipid IV(A) lauroyltransferase